MARKIKGFEDLALAYGNDNFEVDYEKGIDKLSEESITGGESTNIVMNRVFTNRFSTESVKALVSAFEKLIIGSLNSRKIMQLISELRIITKEMRINKEYPMEAILYASKAINNTLKNNDMLVDSLGDFLNEIYEFSPIRNKMAASYIINNWSWNQQLNIMINAIGKIKDRDLIDDIILNQSEERRFETFKCLVNSGIEIYAKDIIKMLMFLKFEDSTDSKISKYFNNFYPTNFGEKGIEVARNYENLPNLSHRGKLTIGAILPKGEEKKEIMELNIGDIKGFVEDNNFDEVSKLLNTSKQRRNCYIAMRWSKKNEEILEKWGSILANSLKKNDLNKSEVGEGIITLAKLGSNDVKDIAHKYISKNIAREHCYGALAIQGNPIYKDKLIDEIFNMNFLACRVSNQCKHKISKEVHYKLNNYLNSTNKDLITKALRVGTELTCKNLLEVELYFPKGIKSLLESDNILLNNSEVRTEIIKSIEQIFDEKTKEALVPSLFLINEDKRSSVQEKIIAKKLLLSIGAAVPK